MTRGVSGLFAAARVLSLLIVVLALPGCGQGGGGSSPATGGVNQVPTVPGAPTVTAVTAGNGSALVSWKAPAAGGSAVTGYTVTASPGGVQVSVGATVTSATVAGLTNGTAYTFTVVAFNSAGGGPASTPSAPTTPVAVPGAPAGVVAVAGNASATLNWTAPADGGSPITAYTVTPSVGSAVVFLGTATSAMVTGLINGTSYTFTVTATNALGTGLASARTLAVTPATIPAAPTGVAAVAGNSNAFVSWTAPDSGGNPIIGYLVTANTGASVSVPGSSKSVTFPNLTNGTAYTFTVSATNALGTGPTSAVSGSVTPLASSVDLAIYPRQAGVTLSQTQSYTATINGSASTAVTWSVDGLPGGSGAVGTITAAGLYTPPASAGTHVVSATSQADSSKVASATIGVTDLAGVFTYHNDNARTGQNLQETALTPANVASSFGKLFSCPVDGSVYAQPLYVANLNLGGGKGVHNVVFVVTMKDSVYAFDADDPACTTYWYQNFLTAGVTVPVPVTDATAAGDVPGTFGIMGTPVISSAASTIYFVDRLKSPATNTYKEQLHALNIATGAEIAPSPVTISASVSGNAQGGTTVTFNPLSQAQRPALLLFGTNVYIAFGSAGDSGNYNGWLLAYDATSLSQTAVFNSTPNGGPPGGGAFWMAGSGPAADGAAIYIPVANGPFDNVSNTVPLPSTANDMGDSLLRFDGTLALQDFFTPAIQATLAANDQDLGSGGIVVLPASMGSVAHPNLVVATDKAGNMYLVDRNAMGRYAGAGNADAIVQGMPAGNVVYSSPAIWGNNLYFALGNSPLTIFNVSNAQITATLTQSADLFLQHGATPSISANGASNAIVWALDNSANGAPSQSSGWGPAILRAYDATTLGTALYSSAAVAADACGNAVKFSTPVIANGKVYVGGAAGAAAGQGGQLTVYGLKP